MSLRYCRSLSSYKITTALIAFCLLCCACNSVSFCKQFTCRTVLGLSLFFSLFLFSYSRGQRLLHLLVGELLPETIPLAFQSIEIPFWVEAWCPLLQSFLLLHFTTLCDAAGHFLGGGKKCFQGTCIVIISHKNIVVVAANPIVVLFPYGPEADTASGRLDL